jgi:hypothetical protein
VKLSNTYIDQDSDLWFVSINEGLFFKVLNVMYQSRTYPVADINKLILRHNLRKLTKG